MLVACIGCVDRTVDSWASFTNGGTLETGTPSLNSTGTALLVTSSSTGRGDVYRIDLKDGERLRLTSSMQFESTPLFLDGSRFAFSREGNGESRVYVRECNSNKLEVDCSLGSWVDYPLQATKDGSHILVRRRTTSSLTSTFVLMDTCTPKKNIELGNEAVLSPDGGHLIYGTNELLWIASISDKWSQKHKYSPPVQSWPLQISNDGTQVLLMEWNSATVTNLDKNIFLHNIRSGSVIPVGVGHEALFDDSGRYVLYCHGFGRTLSVFSVDAVNSKVIEDDGRKKTLIRGVLDGSKAVYGSSESVNFAMYDVMLFDFRTFNITKISSVK
jgi:hypothetical protein